MKNQIEIVKAIAESMEGIGGVPTNADFYEEFNFRLKSALKIPFDVGQSEQLPNRCSVCGRTDKERLTMTSMCGVSVCPY